MENVLNLNCTIHLQMVHVSFEENYFSSVFGWVIIIVNLVLLIILYKLLFGRTKKEVSDFYIQLLFVCINDTFAKDVCSNLFKCVPYVKLFLYELYFYMFDEILHNWSLCCNQNAILVWIVDNLNYFTVNCPESLFKHFTILWISRFLTIY